ncbi:aldehyde reductase [Aliifodinibius salicampi]|uniref:Aldehyde reductase n=1 Tax=Fodinibius salicampi TaxID=1920655 RepID=A0ABT3PX40_9BACT|nr:aldehyde reductase [Fodinibius salicampi]MCW9712436.1 aldehyde reductase [Fodinibius salicampi]
MEGKRHSVLLTGVTGFLGSQTAIQLLEKGYRVTGTLRNIERADHIKNVIAQHTSNIDWLQFAEANLQDNDVWDELMPGIDFVQHIASPFPRELPDHEDELILPAKNGTINILKAASAHNVNVKRVVLTSSIGAIIYGKQKGIEDGIYTEADWTNCDNKDDTTPYYRSKTIAEKEAWKFMDQHNGELEFATVCPGAILGPVLEKDFGTSANIVRKAMDGSMPAVPNIGFDIVDVRSVADLLIRAMEHPEAAGERFIGSSAYLKFNEITEILQEHFPDRSIPTWILPNFIVRLFSYFDSTLEPILNDLGKERKVDSSKSRNVLQWEPLPVKEAVRSCARSLINVELI